jgi:hypothetical protein
VFCFTAYTDEYEGQKRDVEIGVLFGDDDSIAVPVRLFVVCPLLCAIVASMSTWPELFRSVRIFSSAAERRVS